MKTIIQNPRIQLTLVAVLIAICFTWLYFATRNGVHTFDALSYTWDVETKPLIEIFHPHHLLYGPAGQLSVSIANQFGYTGRADQPIQALNALAGALGVLALWQFGAVFTGKRWLSLAPALTVGMCYAYWFYATEVEVYTLAMLFIVLSLWALACLEREPIFRHALFLALATAGAVMFHQTNVMIAIPISVFLLARPALRRYFLPYGFISGGIVAILYIAVAYLSGLRDWDGFYRWVAGYTQTGQWGGYLSFEHLPALWGGLSNTISNQNSLLAIAFYGLALLGFATGGRSLWLVGRVWWGFALVWLILYGTFFWWWEPWNIEFWIVLLPLWALGMLVGIRANQRIGQLIAGGALVLAIALFSAHDAPIRESADPETDYYHHVITALQPHLAPDDLVVTRGNVLDLYVPFYARHSATYTISVRKLSFQGDAFWILHTQLQEAYRAGQTIYVDQIILDEPFSQERHPFGFSPEQIALLRQDFPFEPAVMLNDQVIFYGLNLRPDPSTRDFTFNRSLQGWRAYGAPEPQFIEDRWCFVGGLDPWLISPPLVIPAGETQMTLTMTVDAPQTAQLFWHGDGGDFSEEASIQFPVTSAETSYELDITASETITRLRLDPVQSADGVTICLSGLTIAPK